MFLGSLCSQGKLFTLTLIHTLIYTHRGLQVSLKTWKLKGIRFLTTTELIFEIDEVIQRKMQNPHMYTCQKYHRFIRALAWLNDFCIYRFFIFHTKELFYYIIGIIKIKTFLCMGNFFSIIMFKMTNRCIISYTSLLTTIYIYNVRLDSRFRTLQELTNLKDFVNCIINNLTFK